MSIISTVILFLFSSSENGADTTIRKYHKDHNQKGYIHLSLLYRLNNSILKSMKNELFLSGNYNKNLTAIFQEKAIIQYKYQILINVNSFCITTSRVVKGKITNENYQL